MSASPDRDFDTYATSYDAAVDAALGKTGVRASYFPQYRARYVRAHVGLAPKARVLDYGCGTGNLARALCEVMPDLRMDGYDPAQACVGVVPEDVVARGTFTSEVSQLGREYDCILLSMVLHHVPPAGRPVLIRDLAARLAAGGCLVVFEHNPLNPITRGIVDRCPFDEGVELLRAAETVQLAAGAELRSKLGYMGFFPPPLGGLDDLLRWCPLGAQYAVVARSAAGAATPGADPPLVPKMPRDTAGAGPESG